MHTETKSKEQGFHQLEAYQSGYAKGYADGKLDLKLDNNAGIGHAQCLAGELKSTPRDSTLARLEKELAEIEYNSRRAAKLNELAYLLRENQHVSRILELKAELGL